MKFKREYDKDLTIWGGSYYTQMMLPFSTPQEVRDETRHRIEDLAPGERIQFCSDPCDSRSSATRENRGLVGNITRIWEILIESKGYTMKGNGRKKSNHTYYPSIFNDVIGPVMRGPSSSHCAAALRIGRIARDLMDGKIEEVLVEFDTHGSLATTHASQGSDMGLFGGLLGWEAIDERLVESPKAIQEAGIKIEIKIIDYRC